MLVLTRQVEEAIVIGGVVRVKVLENKRGKIKLGIEAPPEVTVDREEVHIQKELETNGNKSDNTSEDSNQA